ncbi:hypothetical protein [Nonomuraea dietziae]|uniref:DUF1579 domain-containing protein n=1 Tax=Nonomuraea dietziae TaxID=65515 RepID=A0A7W5VAV1_9ACTN|nr:hypothetical protein [Nonomuraea dietziae]MBB3728269.1 hypothetical protein [Nonomuraea dietziae]
MREPHPALQRLNALVGEWEIWATVGDTPTAGGRSVVEWMEGGAFLLQRTDAELPEDAPPEWLANSPFPVSAIIGLDDASEEFTMLYADGRGVHRVYRMTFADGVWRIWREAPGFNQRFTGALSADGASITCSWEMSQDGTSWQHDFDLEYRRVK